MKKNKINQNITNVIKEGTNKLNLAANISTKYSQNNAVKKEKKNKTNHESLDKFECILILRLANQQTIVTAYNANIKTHFPVGDASAHS